MSRKKPIPGQLVFEFKLRRAILRKLKTVNDRVKHLLRVLDDHAGDGTDARLKVETIAAEMCAPKRTTERTIEQAVDEGWIARLGRGRYWRCAHCRAWNRQRDRRDVCGTCEADRDELCRSEYRTHTTYRLLRAAMEHRSGVSRDADQSANLADSTRQTGGHNPPNRRINSATLAVSMKPSLKPLSKPSSNLLPFDPPNPCEGDVRPNPRAGGKVEGIDESASWEAVSAALGRYGCRSEYATESACRQAQANGCTANDAVALIEFAERRAIDGVRAWGPGAILHRLSQHRPGDEIAEFWPEPSPAFTAAEQVERRQSADARERAERAEREYEAAERQAEFEAANAERERLHGAFLDSLPADERRRLWNLLMAGCGRYEHAKRCDLLLMAERRRQVLPIFSTLEK